MDKTAEDRLKVLDKNLKDWLVMEFKYLQPGDTFDFDPGPHNKDPEGTLPIMGTTCIKFKQPTPQGNAVCVMNGELFKFPPKTVVTLIERKGVNQREILMTDEHRLLGSLRNR